MKCCKNKVFIAVMVVVAGLLVAGSLLYAKAGVYWAKGKVSAQAVSASVVKFITDNYDLNGLTPSIEKVSDEGSVYGMIVKVGNSTSTSFATKDGKLFFPYGFEMKTLSSAQGENSPEITKTDKPEVKLYVMSFCPFGNQAEDTMVSVYNLLKDKVDWKIHYIVSVSGDEVTSLHGAKEVSQNEREACVLQDSGLAKWWSFTTYVNEKCGSDGSCWKAASQNAGLDSSAIESCVSERGLALMKDEAAASQADNANGSPTLLINGTQSTAVYQYGNSQAYLDAICSGFNSAPAECSQQLSSSTSASANGSCN